MSRVKKECRVSASLLLLLLLLSVFPIAMSVGPTNHLTYDDPQFNEPQRVVANTPHNPITINGDANFSATALAEGWSGDGSAQNPYVIENYDITMGVTLEASISITNTRVYYIIRGCQLFGPAATPSYGIYLENSTNGQIIDNMVTYFANGLYVIAGSRNLVVTGNNISYNSYSIHWENSDNLTITQNLCTGNFFDSIHILHSDEGTISGNNCSNNGNRGITLENSDLHNLTENVCNENAWYGFSILASYVNFLENNTSSENDVGIYSSWSDFNIISWNIFANSTTINGITDGITNIFQYNYWSDYGGADANEDGYGDTSYSLSGGTDASPLMYPPFPIEWIQPVTDQHVEFGLDFQYSIAVICPAPYDLWINDSTNFWLEYEIIYSRTALAIGDYPLAANATNIYGYLTEAIFTVIVRDTTPPFMTHPDDITYRVDDAYDQVIQWFLSDLSTLTITVLRNGSEVDYYDIPMTSIFFTTNIEVLGAGVYNYTIVAEDIWGNVAADMVLVTILPIPLLEVLLPWVIVISVVAVIVIVIVILLRKRRPKK